MGWLFGCLRVKDQEQPIGNVLKAAISGYNIGGVIVKQPRGKGLDTLSGCFFGFFRVKDKERPRGKILDTPLPVKNRVKVHVNQQISVKKKSGAVLNGVHGAFCGLEYV